MAVFDATIKEYLGEIDEASLLNWEQECDLAERIIENDDPMARDTLVRSNLRLVVSIAKKFVSPRLSLADLIEEGNLGLIRAVDTFDPSHGVRFSTYAAWWIKQSIKRALLLDSGPISVPTYMVELVNHYRQVITDARAKSCEIPPVKTIAEKMGLTVKKVRAIQEIVDAVGTGPIADAEEGASAFDKSAKVVEETPEDELAGAEEIGKMLAMLEKIDARQANILALRFGIGDKEPLTLKQIGAKLGLTRERVRQLQALGLKSLHELMD